MSKVVTIIIIVSVGCVAVIGRCKFKLAEDRWTDSQFRRNASATDPRWTPLCVTHRSVIASYSVTDGESPSDADSSGDDNGPPSSQHHLAAAAAADVASGRNTARQVGKSER